MKQTLAEIKIFNTKSQRGKRKRHTKMQKIYPNYIKLRIGSTIYLGLPFSDQIIDFGEHLNIIHQGSIKHTL
jgi:hypothetical protein